MEHSTTFRIMKPKGLAIILFLLFERGYICKAQAGYVPDTNSIIQANQTAWKLRNDKLEASKKLAIRTIADAEKIQYIRGLSYSYNILAYYYKAKNLYDSAELYYKKSLAIREKLHDTLNIARSYRNLLSIDKLRGNNKNAVKTGLLAAQLLETMPKDRDAVKELALLKTSLSTLYTEMGNYTTAIKYALESQKSFKELDDKDGLASAGNCAGYVYERQKQYNKALEQYKAAIDYYNELDNKRELGRGYCNLGNAYYYLSNTSLARANYKKGVEVLTKNGFEDDIKDFLLNLGILFEESGKTDSAFLYYNHLLKLSIKSGNKKD